MKTKAEPGRATRQDVPAGRIGVVGIFLRNRDEAARRVNDVLSQHSGLIVGRMGVPYREKHCCVITLIVDATTDDLGALTGQLGALEGVSVKTSLAPANL